MSEEAILTEVAREFFPGVSDEEAVDILWQHTSFPFFKGRTGEVIAEELRDCLRTTKATMDAGQRPCDFCGKAADKEKTLCVKCERSWQLLKVSSSVLRVCDRVERLLKSLGT